MGDKMGNFQEKVTFIWDLADLLQRNIQEKRISKSYTPIYSTKKI